MVTGVTEIPGNSRNRMPGLGAPRAYYHRNDHFPSILLKLIKPGLRDVTYAVEKGIYFNGKIIKRQLLFYASVNMGGDYFGHPAPPPLATQRLL